MGHQRCFLWVHGAGGFGSCNIRLPRPNDPVGIDLTPTPIPAAKLRIHTRDEYKIILKIEPKWLRKVIYLNMILKIDLKRIKQYLYI